MKQYIATIKYSIVLTDADYDGAEMQLESIKNAIVLERRYVAHSFEITDVHEHVTR